MNASVFGLSRTLLGAAADRRGLQKPLGRLIETKLGTKMRQLRCTSTSQKASLFVHAEVFTQ